MHFLKSWSVHTILAQFFLAAVREAQMSSNKLLPNVADMENRMTPNATVILAS